MARRKKSILLLLILVMCYMAADFLYEHNSDSDRIPEKEQQSDKNENIPGITGTDQKTCTPKSALPSKKTISPKNDKWKLIWSDEFSNIAINSKNWTYDLGGDGWGNGELQCYTNRSENARVENGNLVIEAIKEDFEGANYTSARLKTMGLKSWTYGKIEARIKVPTNRGTWSAFWMLGENYATVGHPKCGEIDIMEHVNNESQIEGSMWWAGSSGEPSSFSKTIDCGINAYHIYSIEWDSDSIKWLLDGKQYSIKKIEDEAMRKPFFIILNLAIGGKYPGTPEPNAYPAMMYVDYVRVYQK